MGNKVDSKGKQIKGRRPRLSTVHQKAGDSKADANVQQIYNQLTNGGLVAK